MVQNNCSGYLLDYNTKYMYIQLSLITICSSSACYVDEKLWFCGYYSGTHFTWQVHFIILCCIQTSLVNDTWICLVMLFCVHVPCNVILPSGKSSALYWDKDQNFFDGQTPHQIDRCSFWNSLGCLQMSYPITLEMFWIEILHCMNLFTMLTEVKPDSQWEGNEHQSIFLQQRNQQINHMFELKFIYFYSDWFIQNMNIICLVITHSLTEHIFFFENKMHKSLPSDIICQWTIPFKLNREEIVCKSCKSHSCSRFVVVLRFSEW